MGQLLRRSMQRGSGLAVLIAVGCVLTGAKGALADAKLSPEVKAILDKSVAALGGADAIRKVETRVITAKITVVGAGISLDVTSYQKAPGLMSVYVVSPQVGDQVKGTDGTHAWQVDAAGGPRLLEGAEKASLIREANLLSDLQPEKEYTKIEAAGEELVDGKPAAKLTCESPEGKKSTLFYDKESGLLVRRDAVESTPMGDMEISSTMTDYRDAGGVKMAFGSVIKVGPSSLQVTTEKVEVNVPIPAEKLTAPAEILTLIEEAKSAPATPAMPATPAVPEAPAAPAMPK